MNHVNAPLLKALCDGADELCQQAIENAERLGVQQIEVAGATVLDFAVGREGTLDGGVQLAKICLGNHGDVQIHDAGERPGQAKVHVAMQHPLEVCIGAQYAGWPIANDKYFAMGSGPFRMLRGKEDFLSAYNLKIDGGKAVGVLESNEIPSAAVVAMIANECAVNPADLVLCVARTASLPGAVQIVARSVETTLHKLHELGFDLTTIREASGEAPLPPLPADDMTALGWTNDCILYGAEVHLKIVSSEIAGAVEGAIEAILEQIPSCSSSEFGTPFLEIFRRFDHDFYKIDKRLFSPARVTLTMEPSGLVFEVGQIRDDVLQASFGTG